MGLCFTATVLVYLALVALYAWLFPANRVGLDLSD